MTDQAAGLQPGITQSTVTVSGILEADGKEYSQDLEIPHKLGTADGVVVGTAYKLFSQMGGMMIDSEGGLDLYPASKFKAPFKFRLKSIVLTNATGTKPGAIQLR